MQPTTRPAPPDPAQPWPDIAALACTFAERPDISARSVLVTIFGDSVIPTGGEIWLGDLIGLCAPFGFNDRLVRTSMFRLSNEGWFEIERVGRRSRYRLTPAATGEFADADERIYRAPGPGWPDPGWDGTWTLVILDGLADRAGRDRLCSALRRRGFMELSPGTMATPHAEGARTAHDLLARHPGDGPVPVAHARFEHLDELVAAGWPAGGFGLEPLAERYCGLLDRYGWAASPPPQAPTDRDAFLARTMLVHDLRRVRLADADLPPQLWPPQWPAPYVLGQLAQAYQLLSPGAWRWLRAASGSARAPHPLRRFH